MEKMTRGGQHQENPSFAFWCFFCFFGAFHEKCGKSTKKPSAPLARVLSEAFKKVYCPQKKYIALKKSILPLKVF